MILPAVNAQVLKQHNAQLAILAPTYTQRVPDALKLVRMATGKITLQIHAKTVITVLTAQVLSLVQHAQEIPVATVSPAKQEHICIQIPAVNV